MYTRHRDDVIYGVAGGLEGYENSCEDLVACPYAGTEGLPLLENNHDVEVRIVGMFGAEKTRATCALLGTRNRLWKCNANAKEAALTFAVRAIDFRGGSDTLPS
jgi:hypothetical protein